MRKVAPLMSAGMLLQAGGCSFNTDAIVQSLILDVANDLVASILFGIFPAAGF
jgi:hypothetical protein